MPINFLLTMFEPNNVSIFGWHKQGWSLVQVPTLIFLDHRVECCSVPCILHYILEAMNGNYVTLGYFAKTAPESETGHLRHCEMNHWKEVVVVTEGGIRIISFAYLETW